eukprot:349888-Pelagomonas_calceolata.AAC.2
MKRLYASCKLSRTLQTARVCLLARAVKEGTPAITEPSFPQGGRRRIRKRLNHLFHRRPENESCAVFVRTQAGDVAARAGVKVAEADEALQALTFDTEGALEVSNAAFQWGTRPQRCPWPPQRGTLFCLGRAARSLCLSSADAFSMPPCILALQMRLAYATHPAVWRCIMALQIRLACAKHMPPCTFALRAGSTDAL